MDGRRGFVPSNLVEEAEIDHLLRFIPSDPKYIYCNSVHEPSVSSEEQSNSPDEERSVSLLSDQSEGPLCEVQPEVPYPQNLILLNLQNITATSSEITWSPNNGSCTHLLYLNEKKYDVAKAGIYCYTFQNLRPSTQYSVKVEPLVPQEALGSPQARWDQKASEVTFTTPSAGPSEAPRDVQVQATSSADILLISNREISDKADEGFYGDTFKGKKGFIPRNNISEIHMDPTEIKGYLRTKAHEGWRLIKKFVNLYTK